MQTIKIGELAKISGCSIQTIRYYEREKLLTCVQRSEGNFRLYTQQTVQQLLFIKQCRALDLTLAEIRQLISLNQQPQNTCNEVNDIINTHISQVEQRINELQQLKKQLTQLATSCSNNRTIEQCGILQNIKKQLINLFVHSLFVAFVYSA